MPNENFRNFKQSINLIIMKKAILWIVGIFFFLFLIGKMCGSNEVIDDKTQSYVMTREIFKKQILKVPDSAEFQPAYEVTPVDKGDDSYDMTFWVLAQNSFGVKIKTTYNVVVKKTYDDKWKITYMQKIE